MSTEQDSVGPPKPVSRPPMSRIRFFRILSSHPAKYDAILAAYGQAPEMPAIQIPRAAISTGDKVEITDIDIPNRFGEGFGNEPILRADGTRVLKRPNEVIAVFQSQPKPADLANNPYLKKAA